MSVRYTANKQYEVVICKQCGRAIPLFVNNRPLQFHSVHCFHARCKTCKSTSEFSVAEIKSARFDKKRLVPLPASAVGFRNETAVGFQVLGAFSSSLFKYVIPARIDVLENCRIRYTSPLDCNDFAECLPTLDESVAEQIIRQRTRLKVDEMLGQMGAANTKIEVHGDVHGFFENIAIQGARRRGPLTVNLGWRSQVGILSLTADPLNPVMWPHYADNHKGFVIRFVARDFFPTGNFVMWEMGRVWPVIYSAERVYSAERLDGAAIFYEKGLQWSYERTIQISPRRAIQRLSGLW